NMNLAGKINGANQVLAEGVLYGTNSGVQSQQYTYASDKVITGTDIGNWQSGIQNFMSVQGQTIQSTLFTGLTLQNCNSGALFVPGLEVRSLGNLTLQSQSAWDLTNWRYTNPYTGQQTVAGFLTLRAANNLNIYSNLVDHPDSTTSKPLLASSTSQLQPSWGFTLVAGADLNGADIMQTTGNTARLFIGEPVNPAQPTAQLTTLNPAMVYTETGPIQFASAGDTWIGQLAQNPSISYMISSNIGSNLATYSGQINGFVGGALDIEGGAIQSATGNITIKTLGDLELGYGGQGLGTIRTVGLPTAGALNYWEYSGGGNIFLDVSGQVKGSVNISLQTGDWDHNYGSSPLVVQWGPSFITQTGQEPTQGLVTLGGGNLTVHSGGDFYCQAGAFGSGNPNTPLSGGNLTIYSGGSISGRFLVKSGYGELNAMGNFGDTNQANAGYDVLEAFDTVYKVTAQGSIGIGAIVNPTITRSWVGRQWDLTYAWDPSLGPITSATLHAVTGDVLYFNESSCDPGAGQALSVAPPYLSIQAGRNISINGSIALPPSPAGNLLLSAGGNITGYEATTSIYVSDEYPLEVYGSHRLFNVQNLLNFEWATSHDGPSPVHLNDPNPIVISAGGNIDDVDLYLSKFARISAGGNISNIDYVGMNTNSGNISSIYAGGDIQMSSTSTGGITGMQQWGPGWFIVQAGGSIDLGATQGIQSIGNGIDPILGTNGCNLVVLSGYGQALETAIQNMDPDTSSQTFTGGIASFFDQLQQAGVQYSTLQAEGNGAEAQQVVSKARKTFIASLNTGKTGGAGNIEMTSSQICALGGQANIYMMAAGTTDVGKSNFLSANQSNTGIYTASGGSINMFSVGDVNVNEARVMTFLGGDITIWSDKGSINAGRGSKSAVSASPPHTAINPSTGSLITVFQPPSVGSGIRTLTYSPGPGEAEPPEGNIYLFAPSGDIDAGEAGIAGAKVFLGAEQILNTQNITFSVGSVGVPTSATGPSLGALAGVSNLTQAITPQTLAGVTGQAGTTGNTGSQSFAPQWVDVKVIGFYETEQ
ncbi:MAG: filamentous hemagglutinin family protein, partial [Syntrophobacteraceae bacterium]